ncbi:hypothetical protein BsWGS_22063 [Bradybaena similaris]
MEMAMDKPAITSVDSTSDTLTLARLDRENQGPWEAEYSYGGEADLHREFDTCAKNPGHENFIPVDKFGIEDLPEGYRDSDLVDYIRAVSDLTVRVTVTYVSDKRPATVPGSSKPYPGYRVRGRRRLTLGTGFVGPVYIKNWNRGNSCPCKECRNSSTPKMNFATFQIYTASHVVFDEHEGEHTTCHLFFDRGKTPDKCSGVVTLKDMCYVKSNVNEDVCFLKYHTHDLDLAQRLRQKETQLRELRDTVFKKMPRICKFKQRLDGLDKQPLLFIVSHPHGCSKQVSLGRWTSADTFHNYMVAFQYNTATCPGSSGAQVCAWQECSQPDLFPRVQTVHCGADKAHSEFNFCRNAKGSRTPTFVNLDMVGLDKGPWSDELCYVEEADLNKHYAACTTNPGHKNCFLVEKFSTDHLPPSYRSDGVMQFIKLMSDLTVRVSVNYVSEDRPETVPGTDTPYPWSSHKGSNQMRAGTGWIDEAGIADQMCYCKECRNSKNPKTTAAYIHILTAAHLVYDHLEAARTSCQLVFDSAETPGF